MRRCPAYIEELVRSYDRNLGVEWDENSRAWYLTDAGERLFSLDHLDGTRICVIDGCGAEVLEVVKRADLRRTGTGLFRRRGVLHRRMLREREERELAQHHEEMTESGLDVLRFQRQGRTPMIGGRLRRI